MLLHGAYGDAQFRGDLLLSNTVKPETAEHPQGPFGQAQQRFTDQRQLLLGDQSLLRGRLDVGFTAFSPRRHPGSLSHRPTALRSAQIDQEIVSHAIEVGEWIRDWSGGRRPNLQKCLLQDVFDFIRLRPARGEEATKRVTICLEYGRQATRQIFRSRVNVTDLSHARQVRLPC